MISAIILLLALVIAGMVAAVFLLAFIELRGIDEVPGNSTGPQP